MKNNVKNQINWILQEKYSHYQNFGVGASRDKLSKLIKKDVQRLKRGEPIDYIIGFIDFLGSKIDLSKKPLIPRIETEFWVEEAINELNNPSSLSSSGRSGSEEPSGSMRQNLRILDIFSGSGCIGVSIMRHIKNTKVVFSDSENNCIEQIKINCKVNKINKDRYKIVKSNVFKNIKGKFDYIFANPPYIPDYRSNPSSRLRTILRNRIQKSVLKYEPKESIFGGSDGLFYIKNFLTNAKNFLNKEGRIYMEFDSIQKARIGEILKKLKYGEYNFFKDQYGNWRWVVIKY